jgi:hypothetical protein
VFDRLPLAGVQPLKKIHQFAILARFYCYTRIWGYR